MRSTTITCFCSRLLLGSIHCGLILDSLNFCEGSSWRQNRLRIPPTRFRNSELLVTSRSLAPVSDNLGGQGAMGSCVTRAALLCSLALAWSLTANGQSGNEGSIEGIVMDASGAAVSGVALKATNLNTSATLTTTTDENGLFRFPVLSIGIYEVIAERDGFARLIQKNLSVSVGSRINLSFLLTLARKSESIIVASETPLIESTRSQMSFTLDNRTVTSLPVNGRKFIDLALLTPGVTRDSRLGLSFAGQRMMNSVLMDGVDNNNTFFGGGLSPVSHSQISLEAVQEFQVNSNAYSAEFGRAGSGVINMVTKSGSNELHGIGFWYYRDRSMNANDLVNKINGTPKSPFHFNQFGGSVGGPIVANKVFFF